MQEYYFLFGLGILWTFFAVVQDFRKGEISNWLNFSLIAFALAYRFFYASFSNDWMFFVSGFIGFLAFFILAHLFYYGRVFAGGDAKLLMGYGAILPYHTFIGFGTSAVFFLFSFFFCGAIYTLIYGLVLAYRRRKIFLPIFSKGLKKSRLLILIFLVLTVCGFFLSSIAGFVFLFLFVLWMLYLYLFALDKCMTVYLKPWELQEGDWLARPVHFGKLFIDKSVHGLTKEQIVLLKKAKKSVFIKEGIPFTPAFLLALITVFLMSIFGLSYIDLFNIALLK